MKIKYLFLFLLLPLLGQSQSFPTRTYTTQNDLVQSQVRKLFQDSKGYIWIGTLYGVSRFDGVRFENFNITNFPFELVTGINEDSKGNIWISALNTIAKYNGNTFQYFTTKVRPSKIIIDNKDRIWTVSQKERDSYLELYELRKDTFCNVNNEHPELINKYIRDVVFDKQSDRLLLAVAFDGLVELKNDSIRIIESFKDISVRKIINSSDGEIFVTSDSSIYSLTQDEPHLIKEFEQRVNTQIVVNDENEFYIKNGRNKIIRYGIDNSITENEFSINNINCLLIDNENRLWIGSDDGMTHVLNEEFEIFTESDNLFTSIWSIIEDKDENIWFASIGNGLCKFDGNGIIDMNSKYKDVFSGQDFYMGAIKDKNDNLLFPTGSCVLKYGQGAFSVLEGTSIDLYKNEKNNRGAIMYIYEDTTESLILLARAGLQVLNDEGEIVFYDHLLDFKTPSYLTSINKIEKRKYWITSHRNIATIDLETDSITVYSNEDSLNYFPAEGAFSTYKDYNNNWWFGSKDGLFFYNIQKDSFKPIGDFKGIPFLIEMDSFSLVIGASNGIHCLNIKTYYDNEKIEFWTLNQKNGFIGKEGVQNGVMKDSKDNVWICNPNMVTKINFKNYNTSIDNYEVKPIIQEVSIPDDEDKFSWKQLNFNLNRTERVINIPKYENNVRINYKAITYTYPYRILYQFRLKYKEEFSRWSDLDAKENTILTDLKPGNYLFQVRAVNSKNEKLGETQVKFQIDFNWKMSLLWGGCVILLSSLIFYIYYNFYYKRNIIALTDRNSLLRLEALQSQINPHFIFNVLSSVQNTFFEGDKRKANQQVQKLSILMRAFLEASKSDYISLSEELDLLKIYIEFEENRFNNFTTQFIIEDSVNLGSKIPPMLFQPFVENAINHGLKNLEPKRNGVLEIRLFEDSEMITCLIQDNGVGRDKAKELKEKKKSLHVSRGTQLMKDRIEILKRTNKSIITISYTDLYDKDNIPEGTRVNIQIFKPTYKP